jgi:hypothetical protein
MRDSKVWLLAEKSPNGRGVENSRNQPPEVGVPAKQDSVEQQASRSASGKIPECRVLDVEQQVKTKCLDGTLVRRGS